MQLNIDLFYLYLKIKINNIMGKFVIKTQKDGQFVFRLFAGNGQEILRSEAYTTKPACLNGINSVKENASRMMRSYDKKESTNEKPYFNLKAGNGQVIGTSELYESEAGRENGIASVKKQRTRCGNRRYYGIAITYSFINRKGLL
jgi:uncharacterized protein YegP (UPF0339 family)